jgi:hypothetical protein
MGMGDNLQMPDNGLPVWAALNDESLEQRLRVYLWQARLGSLLYQGRLEQLITEAERRGKPEIVTRAKYWVQKSKSAPLL